MEQANIVFIACGTQPILIRLRMLEDISVIPKIILDVAFGGSLTRGIHGSNYLISSFYDLIYKKELIKAWYDMCKSWKK